MIHKKHKERNAKPFRIESSETTSVMLFQQSIKLIVRLVQLNSSVKLLLTFINTRYHHWLGTLCLHHGKPKHKHSHQRQLFSRWQPVQRMDCRPPTQNRTYRNTGCNTSLRCRSMRSSEPCDLTQSCTHRKSFVPPRQAPRPNVVQAAF